jgi:hypothetical protein
MSRLHHLSEELFHEVLDQLDGNIHWIAYNTHRYILEIGDLQFFKSQEEAKEFSCNNISDDDLFRVIPVESINDIYAYFNKPEMMIGTFYDYSNLKNKIMEQNNYEYLANQLKFAGFGEDLQAELRKKMTEGKPEFVLGHESKYGKDSVVAALQFRKSDNSDMYFFNRYNLMLKNEQYPDAIKQTFYINKGQDNITLKEGYNLMAGRAVHKAMENREGEKYNAWVQLDFKASDINGNYKLRAFNDNYGFKLDEVLAKHPIKELQSPEEKQKLVESLQRGNRQMVTLEAAGQSVKIFIEAAPQYKSLNYYDAHGKRMQAPEVSNALKETNGKEQKQEGPKTSAKQAPGDDDVEGSSKKRRTRRQAV